MLTLRNYQAGSPPVKAPAAISPEEPIHWYSRYAERDVAWPFSFAENIVLCNSTRMKPLRLANVSNGLAYPHHDLCHFQSNHGHHASEGYFRLDAMPLRAVVQLLVGGQIVIVDAGVRGRLTDALRFGVPTWCAVYNRAVMLNPGIRTCPWFTRAMACAAGSADHRPLVHTIRKLARVYGGGRPAVIGKNVLLECHGLVGHDDKPEALKDLLYLGEVRFPGRR